MDSATVMHRWANKDFGRNNTLTASHSCHSEGRNYFSYSTVFGQWVDISKNVVVIYEGSTSPTSSKHRLSKHTFPNDVHVFPYDDGGSYYGYHGCGLVSSWSNFKDEDFKQHHRITLLDYYVGRMYERFRFIRDGKVKGLENVNFDMWGYFEALCSIYKDISVSKYLKTLKQIKSAKNEYAEVKKNAKEYNAVIKAKKVMVKLLAAGERDVETITDAMFGEGTFKKYWDYCARFRKSADKRAKVEKLCERLGIASPYESWTRGRMDTGLTADQIRKLTAKERVELHFKALAYKEYKRHEDEREKKYNKNFRNAYKWIVGFEPKKKSWGGGYEKDIHNNCVNKNTGKVYECSGEYIFGTYWLKKSVSFDYDSFRNSEDKEQWIADFYAKCKEVADNRKALALLKKYGVTADKERIWEDDKYIAYRGEDMTECDRILCERFIAKQNKYFADKEVRRRAAEIERLRREEEERKEREYMEQVKQEQIDECLERGEEGCRDLWRKHLMDIHYAERETNYKGDFFMGGNVLLRLNLNKDKVETSKSIHIPVEVCKKMWKIVSKWHGNPKCFKPMQIDTKGSGRYTISSYENDILTAGCHKIAYIEMERMYNEIVKLENVA